MQKIQRDITRLAKKFGFEYEGKTTGQHLKFRHGRTGEVVIHSTTPSDVKALNAVRSQFKKIDEGRVPTDPTKQRRRGRRK